MTARLAELPLVEPHDRAEWRTWLEANHDSSPGVWVAVGKRGRTATKLTYDEAVEEALCFGWIDSIAKRLDDERYRQLFTRRKPGSAWARSNKARIERLIASGCMTPAGLAAVAAAKENGSWTALDEVEDLIVPEDLQAALDAEPEAAKHFSAFTGSVRKTILYRIAEAKRPETRAKRIEEAVRAAAEDRAPW